MSNIVTVGASVDGAFKLIGIAPDGSEVLLHDWQDNLILNNGLDSICYWPSSVHGSSRWFNKCVIGTGTSPPEPTQTTLGAFVAASVSISGSGYGWDTTEVPPYSAWMYITYDFAVDAAAFVSEVGISEVGDGTALVSRIRLEDEEGNPISVPIPSGLALQVIWRLTLYPDTITEKTGTFMLDSVEYGWKMLPAYVPHLNWPGVVQPGPWVPFNLPVTGGLNPYQVALGQSTTSMQVGQFPASYGDIFSGVSGTSESTYVDLGYSTGTYFRDFSCTWTSGVANFSIRTLNVISTVGRWQMLFTPGLPKDDTVSLKITVRITLARHTP